MRENKPYKKSESTSIRDSKNADHKPLFSLTSILTETVLGFIFWSLFQGLGPMVWFYPLNELEISGYECAVVVWFSPLLVGIPGVLRLIQNKWVLAVLRLFSLATLGSFQAKTTLSRLIILAAGNMSAMLVLTSTLWSSDHSVRYKSFWGLILGLQVFICSRIWFTSFVPTWWSVPANSAVIAIGAVATFSKILSDRPVPIQIPLPGVTRPNWLATGLGFGSLLYLTHWCFGEVSLITRWVVRGYPDPGPSGNPWGGLVLVMVTLGILLSWTGVSRYLTWWLLGTCSLCALYYLPTWQGFTGGLILAVVTFSLWPEITENLTLCPPARTLFVAMVIYLVEIFFFVWTVAYNFVPGGVYTREHTDYLIICVCVFIFLGLLSGRNKDEFRLFTECQSEIFKQAAKTIERVVILTAVIGLSGFIYRHNPEFVHHREKSEPKEFVAAIWTYHFGYDNKGWPSLERSAKMLNNTGADFITLLESDASKPFLGNNDLGMWLGEKLGMYVDFGPSTKDHTWGNLIMSKYPIVKSTHHLLPSPKGELAPAITATVNFSGSLVDFVVTHMGNDRDKLDRKLQAKFLSKELKQSPRSAVFLGYMTSSPHTSNYRQLIEEGGVKDIDGGDMDRWCEYIMYKKLIRLGYARISHAGLSDTEVQMAKFRIPEDLSDYKDHDRIITDPKQVPKQQKFTKKFGSYHEGHGYFRRHGYHMSTPKYFLP
ncbi:PGAP2-interacting protein-like [Liolophura sinensis]|uniref:PGAP2-interacting protein-like n=1 Tax=Liolophura sinensis TaxID=3198878 RepID=UPI0031591631